MRDTWVQSLGWGDTLEKEIATHSSTLAWKVSWMKEPSRLQSIGEQRVEHDSGDFTHYYAQKTKHDRSGRWYRLF